MNEDEHLLHSSFLESSIDNSSPHPSADSIYTIQPPYTGLSGLTPPPDDFDDLLTDCEPLDLHKSYNLTTEPPTPPRTESVSSPARSSPSGGSSPAHTSGRYSPDTSSSSPDDSDAVMENMEFVGGHITSASDFLLSHEAMQALSPSSGDLPLVASEHNEFNDFSDPNEFTNDSFGDSSRFFDFESAASSPKPHPKPLSLQTQHQQSQQPQQFHSSFNNPTFQPLSHSIVQQQPSNLDRSHSRKRSLDDDDFFSVDNDPTSPAVGVKMEFPANTQSLPNFGSQDSNFSFPNFGNLHDFNVNQQFQPFMDATDLDTTMDMDRPGFKPKYHLAVEFPKSGSKSPTGASLPQVKSRVETQISVRFALVPKPHGVEKLRLPRHAISKPKFIEDNHPPNRSDTLELFTTLVCASAMNCDDQRERALCEARGEPIPEWVTKIQNEKLAQEEAKDEASPSSNRDSALPNKDERKKIDYSKPVFGAPVQICEQCMNRERKRAGRKKNKKPEEEEKWLQDEALRIIVFNTSQVRKWEPFPAGTGPPNAPGAVYAETQMRICCYCRHHGEKEGFRVIFTIKDHNGNVVAQTLSSTIVITDDHKNAATSSQVSPGAFAQDGALTASQHVPMSPTHLNTGGFVQPNFMGVSPMQEPPSYSQGFGVNGQTNGHTNGHAGSLAGSPSPQMRHSMSPGGHQAKRRKGSKVSANLTMTPAEAPPQYHQQQQQYTHPNMSLQQMRATPEQQLWQNGPIQPAPGHPGKTIPMTGMHGSAPPTNGLHTGGFPTSPMSQQSDNSFFTNGWHVGGPANNGVGQMVNHMPTSPIMYNNQQMKTIPASLPESPRTTLPRVSRVIPHEGPVRGGIDCTLLGHYFVPGLTALFGDIPSTETTFFSESVLICRLPATATPGDVTVSIRGVVESSRTRNPIFTYVDDVDKELMALALTVVGLKMKGKGQEMNTSKQIALQILTDNGLGKDFMPSGGRAGDMSHADLEVTLLKVLDFIDMDDSPHPASLGQRNKSGQSMLHLACMLGMQKFVAALLARGVNVNSRDRNGYTPLHFAALHKKSDVVRRLLMNRADPGLRTKGNETAADLGESDVIVSATRTAQRQVHSRQHSRSSSISEGSGYTRSRSGSVASLRALVPVMTRGSVDDYYDNGSEEDSSDEDEDSEDQNWPSRRGSSHEMAPVVKTVISDKMAEATTQAIAPLNAAAAAPYMAAWMDNWHERFFQGFQGWPGLQLNMPAIPGITTADYQTAILNQMAKIGNPMAKSKAAEAAEESQTVNQEGSDYKWSELFSPPAPPAYDALYPDGNELGGEPPEKILPVEPVQTATASTSALSRSASPSTGLREIHRKIARGDNALTEAQCAEYRSHVAKMKRIQNDRRLYFFWIPILIFITVLVAFNQGAGIWSYIKQVLGFVWTVLTDPLAVRTSVINGVQRVLATPPAAIPAVVPAA